MSREIDSRSRAAPRRRTVRIVALAPQIECETGQPRLVQRFAKRLEVRRRPAQAVNANQRAACLPTRQPLLAGKDYTVRRLPIEMHCTEIRIAFPRLAQAISPMRSIIVSLLAAYSTVATLVAGRLDVAIIQFPEEKAPAELESALAKVNLSEMTNADRTRTTQPYLKGGYVLFAQRLPASPGSSFSTATRLKNASAEVEGQLGAGSVSVSISLMEGVKAGLRTFQKKVYSGFWSASPRFAARSWCPADSRPVPEHRQGTNKDGELSSDHRCRRAVRSLGMVDNT